MKRANFLQSIFLLPFIGLLGDKKTAWADANQAKRGAKIIWGKDIYKDYKLERNPKPNHEEVTFFTPEMLSRNNFGLFIINSKVKQITDKNIGYASTVSWKLCYQISSFERLHQKHMAKYGKVNFLTDGWFFPIGDTKEEVCKYLNDGPYKEKFRLMTKEEVLFIISNRKQGFL